MLTSRIVINRSILSDARQLAANFRAAHRDDTTYESIVDFVTTRTRNPQYKFTISNLPLIHTKCRAAVDTLVVKSARPPPCHHASRDSANEIVRGSERAAVHDPAAAIRCASLIKINYVCRVIVRLIESRDSAAESFRPRRRRKMERRYRWRNRHFARAHFSFRVLDFSHVGTPHFNCNCNDIITFSV